MSVLSKAEIRRLIEGKPPLFEDFVDLDEQLQPNGFDLTLRSVAMIQSAGRIGAKNSGRQVSEVAPLVFDGMDCVCLMPGAYMITYNEVVNLPRDIMALARPRSSLLRCAVNIGTAVWDAGYSGRSQSLMVVYNPYGFTVERNARMTQLVFIRLSGETEGYSGVYQGENR